MAGLGSTSSLSLISPFKMELKVTCCPVYPGETAEGQRQRWPPRYFLLGCGPCAPTCIWSWGKHSPGREEAPGTRGISDEPRQAITGKTCRNASLSRCTPSRRPVNGQSLARGLGAERGGSLATIIPRSGALNQGAGLPLGGVSMWPAPLKLHASVKKEL